MGYVADQNITFSATVDDKSGKAMRGSKVQLIQTVSFHARGKTKKDETVLCEQHRGPFEKTEMWNQVAILIPEDVPSELHHCTNISINYHLQVYHENRMGAPSADDIYDLGRFRQ